FANNYGNQTATWTGYDVTVNLRLAQRLQAQGGVSSGQSVTDNCEVAQKVPEILGTTASSTPFTGPTFTPLAFCHQESGFLTQLKLFGTYTFPRIEVDLTGTVQSIPGSTVQANYPVPTAVAAQALGRPLSGGIANATWNIVAPYSMLTNRINQL